MALLSLIVLVLMTVFNSTQAAFRAGVTQTDVLEGSRSAMDLMVSDLKLMTPAGGGSTNLTAFDNYLSGYSSLAYTPLIQSLPGANSNTQRTNLLNYFFFLTKKNPNTWAAVGYVVAATNSSPLYPLYRYYAETNLYSARFLLNNFFNQVNAGQWTNMSHLIDGVVDLRLRVYDLDGRQLTANPYTFASGATLTSVTNQGVLFSTSPAQPGLEPGFYFYSNSVPAAVELQMGVLEDRALQRAESLNNPSAPGLSPAQINYLTNQVGRVHVFRQHVPIPNVDRTAYQ